MQDRPNTILNSLKYLAAEAHAAGDAAIGRIIDAALEMAVLHEKLQYLEDNSGNQQDIVRIMTFVRFYRSASPAVQRQVYEMIASGEDSLLQSASM